MRRSETGRPPATVPVSSAVLVLAFDTWRLAWREVMTRVELLMLLILSVVSGVAALGSPTAADASVQMLAVCLQVVPFSLVLVVGQIWRRPDDETALYARPLSSITYLAGRGLGLLAIGAAELLAVNLVGDLVLALVARLPIAASVAADAGWSLLVVGPSLVLVVGGALYLVAKTGGGSRYYTPAIVAALLVAFLEYKLPGISRATALRLQLFSPFPGLLTLGLAMPASLLKPVAGWLIGNRLFYLAVGVGLLWLAARVRGQGRETPLPASPRPMLIWGGVTAAVALSGLITLQAEASALAPGVLPSAVLQGASATTADIQPGSLAISLSVNATTGGLDGRVVWTGPVVKPSAVLYLWLNAGLAITTAGDGTTPLDVARVSSGNVLAGTAASLWMLSGPLKGGVPLVITYRGHLLPSPTVLPTPPFMPGTAYEGAYAGHHALYLDGEGSWYPRLLAPGGGGAPIGGSTSIRLTVAGNTGLAGFTTLSQVGRSRVYTTPAGSSWPSILWLSGPYQPDSQQNATVAGAPGVDLSGLTPYLGAWSSLSRWLPGASSHLDAVVSPITTRPLLAGSLLALPGNNPYCVSADPVAGGCGVPPASDLGARLTLAELSWANVLGMSGGNVPALAPAVPVGDGRGQILPVLAALSVYRSLSGTSAAMVAQAWTKGADLPVVGILDATERTEAAALAGSAAFTSPAGVSGLAAALGRVGSGSPITWSEVIHDASS